MAKRQYIIYCDESSKKGPYFSNFYGGALISSQDREAIEDALNAKKEELNLTSEIKWTKVTANYLDKYQEFTKYFFSFVASGRIKIRIMFTQNMYRPKLDEAQQELGYFLLYYQLIKHAFGLKYSNPKARRAEGKERLQKRSFTRISIQKFAKFIQTSILEALQDKPTDQKIDGGISIDIGG